MRLWLKGTRNPNSLQDSISKITRAKWDGDETQELRIRRVLEPDEKISSRWRKVSFISAELKIQIPDCFVSLKP
jgi:hypothetical protein